MLTLTGGNDGVYEEKKNRRRTKNESCWTDGLERRGKEWYCEKSKGVRQERQGR